MHSNESSRSSVSALMGSALLAVIVWTATLVGGILVAMFSTISGCTSALFGTVFFQAIERDGGTDVSFGVASIPQALVLYAILWAVVLCIVLLVHAAKGKRMNAHC